MTITFLGGSIRHYGIGTNPFGGVWVEVTGDPRFVGRIQERITDHYGNPSDGGPNPVWDALEAALGMPLLPWIRRQGAPCPWEGHDFTSPYDHYYGGCERDGRCVHCGALVAPHPTAYRVYVHP